MVVQSFMLCLLKTGGPGKTSNFTVNELLDSGTTTNFTINERRDSEIETFVEKLWGSL